MTEKHPAVAEPLEHGHPHPDGHDGDVTHETHGGEHVHVFEESGIEEGNKPVPKWYVAALLVLGVFFVVYIVKYLTGVQPNSAR
jgi:hypothetical protein